MTDPNAVTENQRPQGESDSDRLRGIVSPDALPVALVSAYAGDRPLLPDEAETVADLQGIRGELFFSDLLYAITHQYFPPLEAERLWHEILRHKYEISKILGRNVQIVVATLDLLTNLKQDIRNPTLMDETRIADIVNLSMRDGLTGFFNHTSCYEIIDLELRRYARHGTVVSLILADIDDFKAVNDECGHQEGDRVLKEISTGIRSSVRDSDVCSRYGGEEFAVILPMTHIREATEIAERIRIATLQIRAGSRAVTLSSGVAACDQHTTTPRDLVLKADRALYEAKQRGKNRVAVAES